MKIIHACISIIIAVIFSSCEKNITLTPPPYNDKPSIQSMLEVDSVPVVYFNRTVPYFGKDLSLQALTIRNAIIKITGNGITDSLRFDSSFSKTYCQYDYYYKGSTPVKLNKTYTLTVVNGSNTLLQQPTQIFQNLPLTALLLHLCLMISMVGTKA